MKRTILDSSDRRLGCGCWSVSCPSTDWRRRRLVPALAPLMSLGPRLPLNLNSKQQRSLDSRRQCNDGASLVQFEHCLLFLTAVRPCFSLMVYRRPAEHYPSVLSLSANKEFHASKPQTQTTFKGWRNMYSQAPRIPAPFRHAPSSIASPYI